jgi:cysteine-rich repeat protein
VHGVVVVFGVLAGCGRLGFDPGDGWDRADASIAADGADAATPARRQLALGWTHACVVEVDGGVRCWGSNGNSQIGLGPSPDSYSAPVVTVMDRSHARLALGQRHTCALDLGGEIRCWGGDLNGELGRSPPGCGDGFLDVSQGEECDDGNTANGDTCTSLCQLGVAPPDQPVPTALPDTRRYRDLFARRYSTCGIALDGTLWCWGRNGGRQLGVGDNADRGRPTQVQVVAPQTGPDDQWASVALGSDHTCALQTDGSLWCWGADAAGQLGMGAMPYVRARPNRLAGTWRTVTCGSDFSCAIRDDGSLWCWGLNNVSQLGLGDTANRAEPALVGAGPWLVVGAGFEHACAIDAGGALYCWGGNPNGQIGIGITGETVTTPSQVPGTWLDVQGASSSTCAIDDVEDVYCWGSNANGRLGDGTGSSSNVPVRVAL